MSSYSIFAKIFVAEFYRRHATLFLLVIGLGFGFMGGYEHMVLASFFTASPALMAIPIIVWIAYAILIERFNTAVVTSDENEFLYMISLYPAGERVRVFILVAACQLFPVILYGVFLMVVATKNHMVVPPVMVLVSLLIIIAVTALRLASSLQRIRPEKTAWWFTKFINARIAKPFVLFYPEWASRNEPVMLAGTKLVCLLLLFATARLYTGETYDLRLMGMAVVVVSYAQCNLVWHLHQFDNVHLELLRNVPMSLLRRTATLLIILLVILSPELGMLISVFPKTLHIGDLISLLLFAISAPVLLYGFLYYRPVLLDRLTTVVFYTSMATFLLVLFTVPVWLLGLLNVLVGVFLIDRFYYRLQFPATIG